MKRLGIAVALVLSALVFAQQQYFRLKGPRGEILVQNFDRIDANLTGPGKLNATGKPVQVYWKDAGMSLTANVIRGETEIDKTTGDYYLKSSLIEGNARFVFDTDDAAKYIAEQIRSTGEQPPPPSGNLMRAELLGDSFQYNGDFKVGTLVMSGAFDINSRQRTVDTVTRDKKVLPRISDILIEAHAASGSVELNTHAVADTPQWRRGFLVGPVTVKYTGDASVAEQKEPTSVIKGTADRVDFDFISPERTLTLTGNVHLEGMVGLYSGSSQADKAVLILGPHNEIKEIRMEGTPTNTNLKARPTTTGGGR